MGTRIEKEEFREPDYARFRDRLEECLAALGQLLEQPGFGTGPATVGAEAELFLVDGSARPLPRNQAVQSALADARVTLELNRFNLELNASPVLLAGRSPRSKPSSTCCWTGWPTRPATMPAGARSSASCPRWRRPISIPR